MPWEPGGLAPVAKISAVILIFAFAFSGCAGMKKKAYDQGFENGIEAGRVLEAGRLDMPARLKKCLRRVRGLEAVLEKLRKDHAIEVHAILCGKTEECETGLGRGL